MWCGRGTDVMGATSADGFCLKSYAQITEARAITFAPNGDLFVAAPSASAPGGASGGPAAIILLSDDDHNGVAEEHLFLTALDAKTKPAEVHGLALGGGYLYFTTKSTVWRTPYADGQRAATGYPENLGLPTTYGTGGRWTHGLARSVGGQLYTSRGAYGTCGDNLPGGDISTIGDAGALQLVATGFRNPMYLRCHRTDEVCAAMELGEDLTPGAKEKMLMLQPSTNYGYPCCLTTGMPIGNPMGATLQATRRKEDASFPLPVSNTTRSGSTGRPRAVAGAVHRTAPCSSTGCTGERLLEPRRGRAPPSSTRPTAGSDDARPHAGLGAVPDRLRPGRHRPRSPRRHRLRARRAHVHRRRRERKHLLDGARDDGRAGDLTEPTR